MTSQAQINTATTEKWNGEAGATVAWSVEGLADAAGRVSAQSDRGASPRDFFFTWSAEVQWQATPTQYGTLDFYAAAAAEDTAADIDGDIGTSDAALGDVDQVRNLTYIGSVIVEDANTTVMRSSGQFEWPHRYLSLVALNNGGAAINATDSNFTFKLTPYNIQGQDT